jgi:hypothetical protein
MTRPNQASVRIAFLKHQRLVVMQIMLLDYLVVE